MMDHHNESNALVVPGHVKLKSINRQLILEAIGLSDEQQYSLEDEQYHLNTCQSLRLEFLDILNVENVPRMINLTRLYLDNNHIERITGIDHLLNLRWLDLSFNRIEKIDGISTLTNLEVFCLFSNKVSDLSNLSHLKKLRVLRVGRNLISNRNELVKLRCLSNLNTLSVKENPIFKGTNLSETKNRDVIKYIIAILPQLVHMEAHVVTDVEKEEAELQYVNQLEQVETERYLNQSSENGNSKSDKSFDGGLYKNKATLFVNGLNGTSLFRKLVETKSLVDTEGDEAMIKSYVHDFNATDDSKPTHYDKFKLEVERIGDDVHSKGVEQCERREREITFFKSSVAKCQHIAQANSISQVSQTQGVLESALSKTYTLLRDHFDEQMLIAKSTNVSFEIHDGFEIAATSVTAEYKKSQEEKVRSIVEECIKDVDKELKSCENIVMRNEVSLVSKIDKILEMFSDTLDQMLYVDFFQHVQKYLQKLRVVDVKYFKTLTSLGEGMRREEQNESFKRSQVKFENETKKLFNDNTDELLTCIFECHENHQRVIDNIEVSVKNSYLQWKSQFVRKFEVDQLKRNRNRISELRHFVRCARRDVMEAIDEMMVALTPPVEEEDS